MGDSAPVGSHHDTANGRRRASPRRPRPRLCLRKGCGRKYTPQCWNQRYCQDPECLRLVRRWQAAKRQAKRRQNDDVKAQQAKSQRARRQRAKSPPQPLQKPEVVAARGHAAKIIFPTPFCARPGCHEPPPKSGRNQAKYCCPACRQAVQRVLDRERLSSCRSHQGHLLGTTAGKHHAAAAALLTRDDDSQYVEGGQMSPRPSNLPGS